MKIIQEDATDFVVLFEGTEEECKRDIWESNWDFLDNKPKVFLIDDEGNKVLYEPTELELFKTKLLHAHSFFEHEAFAMFRITCVDTDDIYYREDCEFGAEYVIPISELFKLKHLYVFYKLVEF